MPQSRRLVSSLAGLVAVGLAATSASAQDQGSGPGEGPVFAPADILRWETEAFVDETAYRLDTVAGRPAVRADCDASASGLYWRKPVDLTKTPILEWSWRVEAVPDPAASERTKAGDDYVARLYVIHDGGLLPWRTRAVNYVWAAGEPVGADWPNAYAGQAHMVAVASGPPATPGVWVTQRRDVRADFRRFHDLDLETIDAVALMTDCDDRGDTARAWFGTVRFQGDR
ncbi:DUF3047 domain-containing protein [Roseospira visakhapatnamensis]|uniref:DUF3047 domain-containing protein n=1 Tax=Roseospira visakhapatnamensis TaxID=390880 RepID=A0A7W6RAZ2_9PROT|nr:DUF3047 domain-containing protein [Roseospira visakhapatnamensis]MBB4265147.1 hypothetical protein [Roseospira visakhapatnamensis]